VAVRRTLGLPDARICHQAEFTAADSTAGDYFGISLALSGSTVVVGAYGRNSYTGAAYVFVRSGRTWSQQAELTAADAVVGDAFGYSVAISGSTVVVGALSKAINGAVYVFVRSGKTWSQQTELAAPYDDAYSSFGWSVAISGSTVVVGSLDNLNGAGVYVFVRSGTTWSQQAELTAADAATGNFFGTSVAISRSTVVVGAEGRNSPTGAVDAGAAYVFVRSRRTWSQRAELTAADGAAFDNFGISVAISRSTVMVGTLENSYAAGAAYMFVRSGRTWSQRAELTAADGAVGDDFGYSVAISGPTALAGAVGKDSLAGAVYVFRNA
jgi:hypothetical protein